ncbi:hypothetical protein [Actinokineospora pegani]|uniref:hypothetical protein n=1 Tax=Actinokineospora pegani TaxID=2654637 RepID=UPI0012E9C6D6|nr:hypothetical protein [Actinokineospora pegani]
MATNAVVNYPEYRLHTKARREANTAIMALLVGSPMAAHLLNLTDGSKTLIPQIFPAIHHVNRFNLTPGEARAVLVNADSHLGTMAVPYALALHEDLMRSCVNMVNAPVPDNASRLHGALSTATGQHFSPDLLSQFHLVREMRNAVIHSGGTIDSRVVQRATALSPAASQNWVRIVGRSPLGLPAGSSIDLGTGEMLLALSVTTALAREANRMLIASVSRQRWAEVIIDDFVDNHDLAGLKRITADRRMKKVENFARFHYGVLAMTTAELQVTAGQAHLV